MNIVVFLEARDGQIKKASLEALSEARRWAEKLQGRVSALVVGVPFDQATAKAAAYKPDQILVVDDPIFAQYSAQSYSKALAAAVEQAQAQVIFLAHTAMGKEVAARAAARFKTSVLSDAVALEWQDTFKVTRPIYSGKAYAQVQSKDGFPVFISLRPNVFPLAEADTAHKPQTEKLNVAIGADEIRGRVTETHKTIMETVELAEAEIIVSGGRGLKAPENFHLVKELAQVLGAAMGASRAVVDAGWIDHQFQVGQTGKVVSPTLYIACGISGAIQHLAGMSSSKCIVAINKDPEAPIFKIANYGIVGDLYEILPKLTEEVRKLKSEG